TKANVADEAKSAAAEGAAAATSGTAVNASATEHPAEALRTAKNIKEEKDLEPYERLFANTAYWKKIGEEYQNPLIVTGTVLFSSRSTSGFVQRDQETYDNMGRRIVRPVRQYM